MIVPLTALASSVWNASRIPIIKDIRLSSKKPTVDAAIVVISKLGKSKVFVRNILDKPSTFKLILKKSKIS
jgi:hypothetical protein